MLTRQLGKNGPEVPVVCIGTWGIGGAYGQVDDKSAINLLRTAVDSGLTFIDTAEIYNDSEKLVGKAITNHREQVFLATKLSYGDDSSERIETALHTSLKLLRTDHIDLYQLHTPSKIGRPVEDTMADLLRYKDAGKIRYIGVSNFSPQQIDEVAQTGIVDSSQPRYSMLFRDSEKAELPACVRNGIGAMVYSVMAKGLLASKYKPGHIFPVEDERSNWPHFKGQLFEQIYSVTEKLKEWAADHGRDMAQLSVAWVLTNPAVTSAIVGVTRQDQIQQNARAGDWVLSPNQLAELENIQGDLRLSQDPAWLTRRRKEQELENRD